MRNQRQLCEETAKVFRSGQAHSKDQRNPSLALQACKQKLVCITAYKCNQLVSIQSLSEKETAQASDCGYSREKQQVSVAAGFSLRPVRTDSQMPHHAARKTTLAKTRQ
jgi:hypothetical protein